MSEPHSLELQPAAKFAGRSGPVVVVVADGVGVAPQGPANAVTEAKTPTLDALYGSAFYTELAAHGLSVGLPSEDDMGNSEVGHNALGAGRIFAQGAKLVGKALDNGSIFQGPVWADLVDAGSAQTLHFVGLHSDGNVHSSNTHLYAILKRAAVDGVTQARLHLLADGRDVAPRSALKYFAATEAQLSKINEEHSVDFRIASGGGRMVITMDRYEADWEMVKAGYDCHVHGVGRHFSSAKEAVETLYGESDVSDQYLERFVIAEPSGEPVGKIVSGDAVVCFNFRGDRSIEISRAFEDPNFDVFDRSEFGPVPQVNFAGLLQYDGDTLVPKMFLVDPPAIDKTMGEYLCATGLHSFAVSETQKFGHVTYFWNGNRSGYIDENLETYVEIPSDNVEYNSTPAMKLEEITDQTIELITSGDYSFGRINYPNGDMVGHTGDLAATVSAIEALDKSMERLMAAIKVANGVLIFTADHGNADIMYEQKDGVKTPKTSHTLSPVPFVIYDPNFAGEYELRPPAEPGLGNVAATALNLMGFEAPEIYDPSLINFR